MELEHRFEVPVGIDRAWAHLLDMQQVADCFPGATLASADGEEYTGSVKVKLGPIQLTYQGTARITEKDEQAHRATIEASGSASRSSSTASMQVKATATELAPDRTAVVMATDLTITGRPAQFGRGVMAEVGNKILGQFADCLAGKLSAPEASAGGDDAAAGDGVTGAGVTGGHGAAAGDGVAAGGAGTGEAGTGESGSPADAAPPAGDQGAADSRPAAAYTRSPEPIDLLESARGSIVKRLVPLLGGFLALWLVRKCLRHRCAKRAAKRAAAAAVE